MIDLDITSIDGFVLALALISIGLVAILFGGLTVVIGAAIVLLLAAIVRYAWVRFDRWARGEKRLGGELK